MSNTPPTQPAPNLLADLRSLKLSLTPTQQSEYDRVLQQVVSSDPPLLELSEMSLVITPSTQSQEQQNNIRRLKKIRKSLRNLGILANRASPDRPAPSADQELPPNPPILTEEQAEAALLQEFGPEPIGPTPPLKMSQRTSPTTESQQSPTSENTPITSDTGRPQADPTATPTPSESSPSTTTPPDDAHGLDAQTLHLVEQLRASRDLLERWFVNLPTIADMLPEAQRVKDAVRYFVIDHTQRCMHRAAFWRKVMRICQVSNNVSPNRITRTGYVVAALEALDILGHCVDEQGNLDPEQVASTRAFHIK